MISKLGYSNYAIFEIKYPKQPSIQNLNDAVKRLEEAEKLFNEGKNEEVVTKCRKSFEILNQLVTIQTSSGTSMTPQLSSRIDMGSGGKQGEPPKSERIEHIRQKIWKLLHIGPHEGYLVSREVLSIYIGCAFPLPDIMQHNLIDYHQPNNILLLTPHRCCAVLKLVPLENMRSC
jgi:hypothetical protein